VASSFEVKLGKNWLLLDRKLELALKGELHKQIEKGTKKSMQLVLKEIVQRIRDGKYQKLASTTLLLRSFDGHGDTPLLRTGGLIRSIATDLTNEFEGEVGLLMKRKGRGEDFSNIGELLHDGGSVRVTDAMKRAFIRKLGATGLTVRPGSGTGIIRIPPRPFIKDVFDDARVQKGIEDIYFDAIMGTTFFQGI